MDDFKEAEVTLTLGKLMSAMAWADGTLDQRELACLKDILFQLPEMPEVYKGTLDIYHEWPLDQAERTLLIEEADRLLSTNDAREFAVRSIVDIARADGEIAPEEESFIKELTLVIAAQDSAFGKSMNALIDEALKRRAVEAFSTLQPIHNILKRYEGSAKDLGLNREQTQKLCLSGLLLAHIAHSDEVLDPREVEFITTHMEQRCRIPREQAKLVTEAALNESSQGINIVRACRLFHQITDITEKRLFVGSLFSLAHTDDNLLHTEREEIEYISELLKVPPIDYDLFESGDDDPDIDS